MRASLQSRRSPSILSACALALAAFGAAPAWADATDPHALARDHFIGRQATPVAMAADHVVPVRAPARDIQELAQRTVLGTATDASQPLPHFQDTDRQCSVGKAADGHEQARTLIACRLV